MPKVQVVLCTFPDPEAAAQAARALVSEGLVACANLLPALRSIYRWEGEIKDDPETLAVFKTTESRFADMEARLAQLHPYDVPEILGVDVNGGHEPYLRWVVDCVG
ncbi:MAG: divalent-cation tolerance protein CutA [Deltaproteobacteria bacterium]|jgi:periplasmic divalent cation tolerance protein|nr:divalent-cation tolerance protein CutA [Deltaproteobacteria bacterium]